MKQILKVVAQSETIAVPSQKAEGGQVMKSTIVLQEPGGKYEDTYVATMLGNTAQKLGFTKHSKDTPTEKFLETSSPANLLLDICLNSNSKPYLVISMILPFLSATAA